MHIQIIKTLYQLLTISVTIRNSTISSLMDYRYLYSTMVLHRMGIIVTSVNTKPHAVCVIKYNLSLFYQLRYLHNFFSFTTDKLLFSFHGKIHQLANEFPRCFQTGESRWAVHIYANRSPIRWQCQGREEWLVTNWLTVVSFVTSLLSGKGQVTKTGDLSQK